MASLYKRGKHSRCYTFDSKAWINSFRSKLVLFILRARIKIMTSNASWSPVNYKCVISLSINFTFLSPISLYQAYGNSQLTTYLVVVITRMLIQKYSLFSQSSNEAERKWWRGKWWFANMYTIIRKVLLIPSTLRGKPKPVDQLLVELKQVILQHVHVQR